MPLPHLLAAAGVIEVDNFDVEWIVKVRNAGVVEREMTVLTDADTTQVEWKVAEESGIARAFLVEVFGISRQLVELTQTGRRDEPFAEVTPKAGRMLGTDTDVLVEVKPDDARPIDVATLHQYLEERQLRVTGGEHGVGDASAVDGRSQCGRGVVSRDLSEVFGGHDAHGQRVDGELADHAGANCGNHSRVAASNSSVISPSFS